MTRADALRKQFTAAAQRRNALFGALFALLGLTLILGGCSRRQSPREDFRFVFELDKKTYRPGEVVRANVRVTNTSGENQVVRAMNYDSIEFFAVPQDNRAMAVKHIAAHSLREEMPVNRLRSRKLPNGGSMSRPPMVFLTMTEEPGVCTVKASYDPNPPAAPGEQESGRVGKWQPTVWSDNSVRIQVEGERTFRRDSNGFLEKEEAIRVAGVEFGRPFSEAEAEMFIDPRLGNLQWWVSLTSHPSTLTPGEQPRRAYFVDPYVGKIRGPAPLQKPVRTRGEMQVTTNVENPMKLPEAEDITVIGE